MPAVLLALAVIAVTALYIRQEFKFQREQAALRLESIAELRAVQVGAWVGHQMRLADFLDDSVPFADLYNRWRAGDAPSGTALMARLKEFRVANNDDSVLVADAHGTVLEQEHPEDDPASVELTRAVQDAVYRGESLSTDIYRREDRHAMPLRLEIVVPLLKTGPTAQGVIVLRLDPRRELFPMLRSWPIPSRSAESVLWERRGERLVNSSDTRDADTTARRIDVPLSTSNLPPARVIRGEFPQNKAMEGIDYRDQKVLSVVRQVAGTDWWVTSKIDLDEVDAPAWERARMTALAAAFALLGTALAYSLWKQRAELLQGQRDRATQQERLGTLGLLNAIARSASDSIFAKDLQGRYVFFNRAAGEVLQRSADDVIGRTDPELFDAATAERLTRHDEDVIFRHATQTFREIMPTPDGEVTMLCTKGPLFDDNGTLIGMLAVSRDVRETRKAELALRDSQQHYESVVAALHEGIVVRDARGQVVSCNPAAERLLGVRRAEWLGSAVVAPGWNPIRPDGSPMPMAETATGRVLEDHRPHLDVLQSYANASGQVVHFEVNAIPTFDPRTHEFKTVVTSFIDVTARKRLEADLMQYREKLELLVGDRTLELQRVNDELVRKHAEAQASTRAKSAFLANTSHEIRTPLNAIMGLAFLMSREGGEPRHLERLGKITGAAQHLLEVINNILDLSKVDAGKLTLADAEFGTEALMAHSVEMVANAARARNLELIVDLDHLPARLRGDFLRLSQILINLLSNAVKFTDSGWVRLRAEVVEEEPDRIMARFEVQDTGRGIDAAGQRMLFNAFEQVDAGAARQAGGTGLGLALSRQLARAMGGEAGVRSAPGHGSTFWFTAWLAKAATAASGPRPSVAGQRVLLVDDLREARLAIGEQLRMLGLTVDVAASGPEAVDRVRQGLEHGWSHDLFVLDLYMAPMDGVDTKTALTDLLGRNAPPAVLVTASDDARSMARAAEGTFERTLLKPVTASALLDMLVEVLHLPPSNTHEPVAARGDDAESDLRTRHAGQRILLVEDNPVNREVSLELLRSAGLQVETADDGVEAIDMATSRDYDLVLMDVQIPRVDGLQATRAIRARRGGALPIIAMTANAYAEDRAACLAAGMDDHVSKPVVPDLLYTTLGRWLPAGGASAAKPGPAVASAAIMPLAERLARVDGLDTVRALRLVGGMPEALERVLGRFVETYRDGLPSLLDLSGSEDDVVARWRATCHASRSAISVIGGTAIAEEGGALEAALSSGGSPRHMAERARRLHESVLAFVAQIALRAGAFGHRRRGGQTDRVMPRRPLSQ